MRTFLTPLALAAALICGAAAPAWADVDDGFTAYEAGDYATALKEWRPLAEQGYASAQYNLGLMYGNGEGVPLNYIKAYMWTSLAKAQGNKDAAHNLDLAKSEMTAADISEAQRLATEWWEAHQ